MAGVYADVPAPRMAYDRDGTQLLILDAAATTVTQTLSSADRASLNDESSSSIPISWTDSETRWICLLFPEQRTLSGYHVQRSRGTPGVVQVSSNTTSGADGTWTSLGGYVNESAFDKAKMRTAIQSVSQSNVKGVRFQFTWPDNAFGPAMQVIHLYGTPSAGTAPNRLRFWHPTLDQEVGPAFFDWGDVFRSTTLYRDFRIKNPSSTLTAQSVSLTMESLTDGSPTNTSAHSFSLDDVTYAASLNIGNLAPGAISSTIRLRRVTPANAPLALWWTRIVASAAAYS